MMRIAQVIDSLRTGGAEMLQIFFAQQATSRNLPFTIISLRNDPDTRITERLRELGASVITMPARKSLDPIRFARLAAFFHKNKFDIVHTHLNTANIVGTLAAHLAGRKVISTLHNIKVEPSYYNPVRYRLETQTLRHAADRVVAVGAAVAEAHQIRLQRRIDVIPNAVEIDCRLSYVERLALRSKLCGNPDNPILISVGRLSAQKGFEDLIDAFAIVHRMHPSTKLLIAGAGFLKDRLTVRIQRLGLESSLLLLGRYDDVPKLLAACDLYVSSSLWEGLPLSILEAMSAGLPVVATAVGDVPHIVTNESGYLVPPGNAELFANAVCHVLDHPEQGYQMGRAGRDLVQKNHHPSIWMNRLVALYNEVLFSPALRKAI